MYKSKNHSEYRLKGTFGKEEHFGVMDILRVR